MTQTSSPTQPPTLTPIQMSALGGPQTLATVQARLATVLAAIAEGAVPREIAGDLPVEQVEWIRAVGFGALRVPVVHGGAGLSLPDLTSLWIDLAAADSNLTQALRGHAAFVEDRLWAYRCGQDQGAWFDRFAAGHLVGNAWSETGGAGTRETLFAPESEAFRLDGRKYYTTGSIYADWIDVRARRADGSEVIALVCTDQPGVQVLDDWDGFGQRGTGSGTAIFTRARVEVADVVAVGERFPYQSALYQLNLLATLVGIGRAALRDVVDQVRARCRNFSHANTSRVRDDPQVLARVGEIAAAVRAAEAVTLAAAAQVDRVAVGVGTWGADELARLVEEAEVAVSSAQVVVTDLVLRATSDLFDTLGASATSRGCALDRHWRNARTVSSHNPRILKARVVGENLVNGTAPPHAWVVGATERGVDGAGVCP